MLNFLKKTERGRAQVSGIRKVHGWFLSRLASPLRGRAFFALLAVAHLHNFERSKLSHRQATGLPSLSRGNRCHLLSWNRFHLRVC